MRASLQRSVLRAGSALLTYRSKEPSTSPPLPFPRLLGERHRLSGWFSDFGKSLYRLAQAIRIWSGDLTTGERYGSGTAKEAEASDCDPEACCGEASARQRVPRSLGTCKGSWAETPFRRGHLRCEGSVGATPEGHNCSLATVSGFHSPPSASWLFKGDSNFLSNLVLTGGVQPIERFG